MAEPAKNKKPSIRQILDEIAADASSNDEERVLDQEKARELEYKEWCSRQMKSNL